MPECSIRIIGMRETERVAAHYHEKCTQIYTVLEHTCRLCPYETVRIEQGTVHSVRAAGGTAPVPEPLGTTVGARGPARRRVGWARASEAWGDPSPLSL